MYPVGTKCVITRRTSNDGAFSLGIIVTVGPHTEFRSEGECQEITEAENEGVLYRIIHPTGFMIPLEPDTSIMEDLEEIKRLADEIIT